MFTFPFENEITNKLTFYKNKPKNVKKNCFVEHISYNAWEAHVSGKSVL